MLRTFTLEEAEKAVLQAYSLTAPVAELTESLAREIHEADISQDSERIKELELRIQTVVESWTECIHELDGEVKGIWLVDFNSGDGYWCWRWPEPKLNFWHTHEGGFRSREELSIHLAKEGT